MYQAALWWKIGNIFETTHMVPPTFTKIGQLVLQSIFKNFEHDGNNDTEPPIPQN